jgi:hypothetical protein
VTVKLKGTALPPPIRGDTMEVTSARHACKKPTLTPKAVE